MPAEPATKTCPECAETVLAAARKCRFGGYRFAPPPVGDAGEGGFLSLLRRTKLRKTGLQLLDEWGVPYDDAEPEPLMLNGMVDGAFGFIAVTTTRLCFAPVKRVPGRVEVRQHQLNDLVRIHTERRRRRQTLFVEWRDRRMLVELDARQHAALQAALAPHALVQSPDLPLP